MSRLSNYTENAVINHLLRGTGYTFTQLYLAAHTADPGDTGANELAGGGYARTQAPAFSAASGRSMSNTETAYFPLMLAAVGTITHLSLWDSSSGGNLIWYSSAIPSPIETSVGRTPSVGVGALVISMSGGISTYAANKWLDLMFSGVAWSTPTPYASLHTADPGLTGANEVSNGNAYARVSVSTWNSPSNGTTANTNTITYPTPTPSSWGTITHQGYFDASSAGNFLIGGEISPSILVQVGFAPDSMAGDVIAVAA